MNCNFLKLNTNQSFRFLLFLLLQFLAASSLHSVQAELSYLHLKGITELVDDPGASPVHGYTALKAGLANRRFLGNYGAKKEGHSCRYGARQVAGLVAKNPDCPQDFNSEWLQRLFPSRDGENFVANQVDSDPVSHLTPEVMGRVLQRISRVPDSAWTQAQEVQGIENDLMLIFYEGLNPGACSLWLQRQQGELGRLTTEKNTLDKKSRKGACSVEEKGNLTEQANQLGKQIASLQIILNQSFSLATGSTDSGAKKIKGVGKEKDFRNLAQLLVGALKESRVPTPLLNSSVYPKHLPEHALLAFFIKRAESKADLIELFRGMPSLVRDPEFLDHPEKQRAWILDQWKREDYHLDKIQAASKEFALQWVLHPEQLIFARMEEDLRSKLIPPILSYAKAKHQSLGTGTYSDCGETSLRNFFNMIFYDPATGKFDLRVLTQWEKNKAAPELLEFYRKYSDPSSASTQVARDDWSAVVSGRPSVHYLKPSGDPSGSPQCEISSGVDNMMAVIDALIFSGKYRLSAAGDRAERLDHLCRFFSLRGKKLSWSIDGEKGDAASRSSIKNNNSNINIKFNINGKPSFSWEFMQAHFTVSDLTETKSSWKDQLGATLIEISQPETRALLPWFASPSTFDALELREKNGASDLQLRENLIYALPLVHHDGKLEGFKRVVSSPREQALALRPLAERIRAKLPEEADLYTRQRIYSALADANHPYEGDRIHPLGNPEVSYIRVSSQYLGAAKKMGRSWMRDVYGHNLAIGEPLMDDRGKELFVDFNGAQKACIELNPPELQKSVERAFNNRETALDAIRQNKPDDFTSLGEVHRTHPILGCYLMSREEWTVLQEDFRAREKTYVPQVLPNLANRFFWSATVFPGARKPVCIFDGNEGVIHCDGIRSATMTVRCACAVPSLSVQ